PTLKTLQPTLLSPPWRNGKRQTALQTNGRAYSGRKQIHIVLSGCSQCPFNRFGPPMPGKGKSPPVRQQHLVALYIEIGLDGFFRKHMGLWPAFIVLAAFYQSHIKRAVLVADFLE